MSNLPGRDGSLQEQTFVLVGFWVESLLYGAYTVMFAAAIVVSLKNRRTGRAFSMVLFLSMISMFIMITVFTFINLYRGIQAFALNAKPPAPINYYHRLSQWDNFAFPGIVNLLTWHADALMIYRCFIIYNYSIWVTVIPGILLIFSIISNSIVLAWLKNPTAVSRSLALSLIDTIYPINLTQSFLTTGLISYKIYQQHRRFQGSGMSRAATGGMSLLTVIRIVVEGAMIFTVQQFILLILLRVRSPAQVIFHVTTIPSIGIVFVLMALRTYFAQTASEMNRTGNGKYISRTSTTHHVSRRSGGHGVAVVTTRTVHEDIPMQCLDIKGSDGQGNPVGSPSEDGSVNSTQKD